MTIDQLNKDVLADIKRLSEGKQGEVIFDDEFFGEIIELDPFLDAQPDVVIDIPEDADDEWWMTWKNKCPPKYRFLLGMYIPMRPPRPGNTGLGQVILFGENLQWFFKTLLREIQSVIPHITKSDLIAAWEVVRRKTHEHELFHYNINVFQNMHGGSYTPIIEEALAVAWARMQIQKQRLVSSTPIGKMNGPFFNLLMQLAFNYQSSGYRDWGKYADDIRFKPAHLGYISPGNYRELQSNRVDVENMLYGMIGQMEKGYVENVW